MPELRRLLQDAVQPTGDLDEAALTHRLATRHRHRLAALAAVPVVALAVVAGVLAGPADRHSDLDTVTPPTTATTTATTAELTPLPAGLAPIDLPFAAEDVAVGPAGVFVAGSSGTLTHVARLDPATGSVLADVTHDGRTPTRHVAAAGQHVWAWGFVEGSEASGGVLELDPSTLGEVGRYGYDDPEGVGPIAAAAVDDVLWLADAGRGVVTRLRHCGGTEQCSSSIVARDWTVAGDPDGVVVGLDGLVSVSVEAGGSSHTSGVVDPAADAVVLGPFCCRLADASGAGVWGVGDGTVSYIAADARHPVVEGRAVAADATGAWIATGDGRLQRWGVEGDEPTGPLASVDLDAYALDGDASVVWAVGGDGRLYRWAPGDVAVPTTTTSTTAPAPTTTTRVPPPLDGPDLDGDGAADLVRVEAIEGRESPATRVVATLWADGRETSVELDEAWVIAGSVDVDGDGTDELVAEWHADGSEATVTFLGLVDGRLRDLQPDSIPPFAFATTSGTALPPGVAGDVVCTGGFAIGIRSGPGRIGTPPDQILMRDEYAATPPDQIETHWTAGVYRRGATAMEFVRNDSGIGPTAYGVALDNTDHCA